MQNLISYSKEHPHLRPSEALDQLVESFGAQNGPPNMNFQNFNSGVQPSGSRTPGTGGFALGASPAVAHLNLPGSPHVGTGHTPSPAQNHIQAPGMVAHPSQQGTSSSGPSANTSPNVSSKRRRPSTIKNEGDDGGGEVNGVQPKVKPGGKRKNPS